jgi:hypothetical protein
VEPQFAACGVGVGVGVEVGVRVRVRVAESVRAAEWLCSGKEVDSGEALGEWVAAAEDKGGGVAVGEARAVALARGLDEVEGEAVAAAAPAVEETVGVFRELGVGASALALREGVPVLLAWEGVAKGVVVGCGVRVPSTASPSAAAANAAAAALPLNVGSCVAPGEADNENVARAVRE